MTQIVLTKRSDLDLTDTQRQVLRECLFEMVDGQAEEDQKAWRRFWNGIWHLGSGEFFSIQTLIPRFGPAHRKQMKLEGEVFKNQERFKDRETFRLWVKVGSGWVVWAAGPRGGVFPVPKSISYAKCDEGDFQIYCDGVLEFFRTSHAQKYLWPHASAQIAEQSMEAILCQFEVSN
ncbi:hypothetical protein [Undibacterium sp. TJN19]|uniref:hypothetical protein n=1 Tax=Undibacterium sp. TJN19 TaxID=3413055 RepID=UPI003BF09983